MSSPNEARVSGLGIESTNPTLIEVVTPYCGECRAMKPDIEAVADQYSEVVDLVVLDATEEPERVAALGVLGTPTLIAVDHGVEQARFTGRRSRAELTELFASVAGGHVGSVRRSTRADRAMWLGAGMMLIAGGLLTGPSWVLVVLGVVVLMTPLVRSLLD